MAFFNNIFLVGRMLFLCVYAVFALLFYFEAQTIVGITERQRVILARQVIAALIPCPFLLPFAIEPMIGRLLVPSYVHLGVVAVCLGYISVTSIAYRISILTPKHSRKKFSTGGLAVFIGIVALIGSVVLVGVVLNDSGLAQFFLSAILAARG